MSKRRHGVVFNLASLLLCGVTAGIVVAAIALPAAALPGLAAKTGADELDKLPQDLVLPRLPQISYVYASDGTTVLSTFHDENRHDVPLDEVADPMWQAMVAAEDMRFFQHKGVDIKGVIRALVANQRARSNSQGASTLTMQYVRQAMVYSPTSRPEQVVDATADTTQRKLREMQYARALEKRLDKRQILERYLNIAPFGNGAFGIWAASETYFGKLPKDLTVGEAALLAGLVQAPGALDPLTKDGRKRALERRDDYVLKNMVELHDITEAQRQQAMRTELKFAGTRTPNGCVDVPVNHWGYFCDYLYRWWLRQPAFGADPYERANRLRTGGYSIVSSLDIGAQQSAVNNVVAQEKISNTNPDALMLAGVEPGTGRIKLMAVNRTYSNDQSQNGPSTDAGKRRAGIKGNYPNTTLALLSGDGDVAGYQFGSTFKMFTLLTALSQGLPLATTIDTKTQYVSGYIVDSSSPAACQGNHYCPQNDNAGMAGVKNMWTGFGQSVNTFFVPLEERVGADNVVAMAQALGVTFNGDPKAPDTDAYLAAHAKQWGAFTLGVSATTPLIMANAYATVAAEGRYCEPLPVAEIRDFSGKALDVAQPRCKQAVDPDVARAAADAARCPVGDSSAFGQCSGATAGATRGIVKRPVAGKTGTTDHNRTAALIAMTRQIAIAGVIADPDNPNGHNYSHAQVNAAVQNTLRDAMAGLPALYFTKPSDKLAFGVRKKIPDVTCQPVPAATATLKQAGFSVKTDPTPIASTCPAGTVAKTAPSGSTTKGGIVTLYLSRGSP